MAEKIKLTVSQIKADLKSGLDRKSIGLKYGLRPSETKLLFQNPALKGLRVGVAANFELIDDEADATATVDTASTTEKPAPKKAAKPTAKVSAERSTEKPAEVVAEEEEDDEDGVTLIDDTVENGDGIKEVASNDDKDDDVEVNTTKGLW